MSEEELLSVGEYADSRAMTDVVNVPSASSTGDVPNSLPSVGEYADSRNIMDLVVSKTTPKLPFSFASSRNADVISETPSKPESLSSFSYVQDEPEYAQSDLNALAGQMNSIAALSFKRENMQVNYDVPDKTRPFNILEKTKFLEEQGVSGDLADDILRMDTLSWKQFGAAIHYRKKYQEQQQQVANEWSTAGMIAAGLPMGLFDIDLPLTLATGGVFKVATSGVKVGMTLKAATDIALGRVAPAATSLAAKLGRSAPYVNGIVGGAGAGFVAEGVYQNITEQYDPTAMATSVVFGAAFGGALPILSRIVSQTGTTVKDNLTGQTIKVDDVSAVQEVRIRDTIDAIDAEILAKRKEVEEAKTAPAAREADEVIVTGREEVPVTRTPEFLKQQVSTLDRTRTQLERVREDVATFEYTERTLGKQSREAERKLVTLNKQLKSLEQQKIKAEAEATAAKTPQAKSGATRRNNNLAKKIEAKKAEIQVGKGTRLRNLRALDDHLKSKDDVYASGNGKELDKELDFISEELRASRDALDEVRAEADTLPPTGGRTLTAAEELAELEAGKLQAEKDLALLQDGQSPENNYGIVHEYENPLAKLDEELQEVNANKNDLSKSDLFQKMPEFVKRRFVISPIERLLASKTPGVSGLASLLHPGTLHHGKANTKAAWNIKHRHDRDLDYTLKAIYEDFYTAKKEGYEGTVDEWFEQVGSEALRTAGNMQRRANELIPAGVSPEYRRKKYIDNLSSMDRIVAVENKQMASSVERFLDFFELSHTKGSKLEIESFIGSAGRGYVSHLYSPRKIEAMGGRQAAIDYLVNAQFKKSIADGRAPDNEMRLSFINKAEAAVNSALDPNYIKTTIGSGGSSVTKQRTIDVYDDDIADILENHAANIASIYGRNVHGMFAMKEAVGVSTVDDFMKLAAPLINENKNPREAYNNSEDFKAIAETIYGVREIPDDPMSAFNQITKGLSSVTSVMNTMSFGLTTLTEIGAGVGEFGGIFARNLGVTPSKVISMYRSGSVSEMNQIDLSISYGDSFTSHRMSRFDMETNVDTANRIQESLDYLTQKESVYGGMLPVTDMLRMATASSTVDFLAKLSVAKKVSKADYKRALDAGFDFEDLKVLRDKLKVSPDGRINNMDRKTWGKDLDDKILYGVQTMVDRVILSPNGITLPRVMSTGGVVPRVLTKFMRFPIESYERLGYRGIQNMDAKRTMGIAVNAMMWASLLMLKDATKEEPRYAGEDWEKLLLTDALYMNSFSGGVTSIVDTVGGVATGTQPISGYRYTAGGAVFGAIQNPRFKFYHETIEPSDAAAGALQVYEVLRGL